MSHFLQRDSDSDTDSTTSTDSTSSSNNNRNIQQQLNVNGPSNNFGDNLNLPPGVFKWMKKAGGAQHDTDSDDDSSEEQTGAISREDRNLNQLGDLCDKVEYYMEAAESNFTSVIDALTQADAKAVSLIKTFDILPKQYFQLLQFLADDIDEKVADAKKALEEAGDAENDAEESGDDDAAETTNVKKERAIISSKTLKRLRKLIQDKLDEHKSYITRMEKAKAAGEDDDGESDEEDGNRQRIGKTMQDLSELGMLRTIMEHGNDPRNHAPKFERIVIAAAQQQLHYIAATANAILCVAVLVQEESSLFLPRNQWRKALDFFNKAMNIIIKEELLLSEKLEFVLPEKADDIRDGSRRRACVVGGLHTLARKLKDSLYAWMQWNNATHIEYPQRIVDEQTVLGTLDSTLRFYSKLQQKKGQAQISQSMLEIVAPRNPKAHQLFMTGQPTMPAAPANGGWFAVENDVGATVKKLYEILIANNPSERPNAILLVIINFCLRDDFSTAREMFLLFGCNDTEARRGKGPRAAIQHARCVAQLGLCAFRNGYFTEAKLILDDLVSKSKLALRNSNEIKTILGQKEYFRDLKEDELEEVEQRRFVQPPHHHVPVLLIETAQMVISVLDEALAEARTHHRARDRLFLDILRRFDHRALAGEPADDAEALYATYRALLAGNVGDAIKFVTGLSAWSRLPNKEETVDTKLVHRVKVDGLRTFLIAHGNHFKSLTVDHLAHKFLLPADEVRAVVSHLVLHENSAIVGSFDRDSERLMIDRGAQPRIHELAKEIASGLARDFQDASVAHASHGGHGGGYHGGHRGGRGRGRGGRGGGRGRKY